MDRIGWLVGWFDSGAPTFVAPLINSVQDVLFVRE